jgi:hypothetical protein
LSLPDKFLVFGGGGTYSLNILPFIMTIINCISGAVYTKGFPAREKIQIYGMAVVFFVLLYNSPAGLVLYWTANNIFSLLKNILSKTKHAMKIVWVFLCLCVITLIIRFIPLGFSPKRLFVIGFCSLIFFVPFFIKIIMFCKNKLLQIFPVEQSALSKTSTYIFSALILLILTGFVIPGSLISSSVQEFSFLDSYTTPLPFLVNVFIQAFGFFLLWPLCVYFLFSKKIKYALCLVLSLLCIASLVNTFIFPGDYGFLTTTFKFSNPDTFESKYAGIIISALVTFGLLCICAFFSITKRRIIFQSLQIIVLASLIFFGIINLIKINKDFKEYENILNSTSNVSSIDHPEPVYYFSKGGKNVIVLMLDSAISGYLPYIFDERPELFDDFTGFTYYPNCISLGTHTRIGAPLVFGGYEYEPELIQRNRSYAMEKHNEALLMMPRIFQNQNYNVTVTDPSFANYSLTPDLSIFSPYPEIKAMNIQGKYTGMWLRLHPDIKIVSVPELLNTLLLRFSLLKISPSVFRVFIYDKSKWLKPGNPSNNNQLSLNTLDYYTTLDYLPQLTLISDNSFNTYTSIVNDLTHDAARFQYPDYIPSMEITNPGNGPFAEENTYHVNITSLLLLGKWFKFLQEREVYDNIRIIIVSDHGWKINSDYTGNIELPDNNRLSAFHALLLVKDFESRGNLVTDNTFMTIGDVPLLAMNSLIENPINPFSGNLIESDKENGVMVTTAGSLQFSISNNQWLHVKDNIFDPANWRAVNK